MSRIFSAPNRSSICLASSWLARRLQSRPSISGLVVSSFFPVSSRICWIDLENSQKYPVRIRRLTKTPPWETRQDILRRWRFSNLQFSSTTGCTRIQTSDRTQVDQLTTVDLERSPWLTLIAQRKSRLRRSALPFIAYYMTCRSKSSFCW